jgi:Tol biopolymer transport system component
MSNVKDATMLRSIGRVSRALAVVTLLVLSAVACRWTAVVSVDPSGNRADGHNPAISADGRFVVFTTSQQLTADDHNGFQDVYRRDLRDGTIERVTKDAIGGDPNADSVDPVLSEDGRFVAFTSGASNVVPGDTNGLRDVYVRDMQTGQYTRVSVVGSGSQLTADDADVHSMSADGSKIAFTASHRSRLDSVLHSTVYVRDLATNTTTDVGLPGAGIDWGPSLSADGAFVAFTYEPDELSPQIDENAYLRRLGSGELTVVSIDPNGGAAGGFEPSVSGDGRYVAFESDASNLVAGDNNGTGDIFVRDLQTNTTRRVSVSSSGGDPNGDSFSPDISADGRFVAFDSWATDLGPPGDLSGAFVRDLAEGSTTRTAIDPFGNQATGIGEAPKLSGHGEVVVYTAADNGSPSLPTVYAQAVTAPTITSISPQHLVRGSQPTLTITGTGFRSDARVFVTSAGVSVGTATVLDEHRIQVTLTVAPDASQATGDVFLVVPGPGTGSFGMSGSVAYQSKCLTVT